MTHYNEQRQSTDIIRNEMQKQNTFFILLYNEDLRNVGLSNLCTSGLVTIVNRAWLDLHL